jgi:hypothetical protein
MGHDVETANDVRSVRLFETSGPIGPRLLHYNSSSNERNVISLDNVV